MQSVNNNPIVNTFSTSFKFDINNSSVKRQLCEQYRTEHPVLGALAQFFLGEKFVANLSLESLNKWIRDTNDYIMKIAEHPDFPNPMEASYTVMPGVTLTLSVASVRDTNTPTVNINITDSSNHHISGSSNLAVTVFHDNNGKCQFAINKYEGLGYIGALEYVSTTVSSGDLYHKNCDVVTRKAKIATEMMRAFFNEELGNRFVLTKEIKELYTNPVNREKIIEDTLRQVNKDEGENCLRKLSPDAVSQFYNTLAAELDRGNTMPDAAASAWNTVKGILMKPEEGTADNFLTSQGCAEGSMDDASGILFLLAVGRVKDFNNSK